MIDHRRPWIGQPERLQQRKLQRLGSLITKRLAAIHYARSRPFQMSQIMDGVKNGVSISARPGRRAHSIKNQPKLLVPVGQQIEVVPCRV